MAALTLQAGQFQLQIQKRDQLSTAQVRTMEGRQGKSRITEGDDAISILKEGKERAAVVTAHDGTDGQVDSTSGSLTFRTGNVFANQDQEQMRITPEGRVGIGTRTPETTLDVAGTIKARGGIQFDDGSVLSSAKTLTEKPAAGAGGNLSGTNIIIAINDPATAGAISDNRVSLNLARLAAANTWTNFNTFSAGLSANNAQITNVGNPVSGGDAVNKNYVDANAVRFMPGAAQLTVGDANGTAAMINLRGQSTCCGPTTGFARSIRTAALSRPATSASELRRKKVLVIALHGTVTKARFAPATPTPSGMMQTSASSHGPVAAIRPRVVSTRSRSATPTRL
jgi:hypothetical protein